MRVANKGNVAGNVGIIMMMITNNYFTQSDGWHIKNNLSFSLFYSKLSLGRMVHERKIEGIRGKATSLWKN